MENNNYFLLIHTMTVVQSDVIVQAQFFHAFSEDLGRARFVGKRMSLRLHPGLKNSRNKSVLQRLYSPNLRCLMKRKSFNVRHHLRAVHVNSPTQRPVPQRNDPVITEVPKDIGVVQESSITPSLEKPTSISNVIQLSQISTPQETKDWLVQNRFENYLDTFEKFSGDDMLRMSRDDLRQICGNADGIRLHNAIHLKTITPKLKLYVCQENSTVFNAVFLSSYSSLELLQKLSKMVGLGENQVRNVYLEGPQSIHIKLNEDVLKHIKEEAMFSLQIISHENSGYILLLKRTVM